MIQDGSTGESVDLDNSDAFSKSFLELDCVGIVHLMVESVNELTEAYGILDREPFGLETVKDLLDKEMDDDGNITTDDGDNYSKDQLEEMRDDLEDAETLRYFEGPYVFKRLYQIPEEEQFSISPIGW